MVSTTVVVIIVIIFVVVILLLGAAYYYFFVYEKTRSSGGGGTTQIIPPNPPDPSKFNSSTIFITNIFTNQYLGFDGSGNATLVSTPAAAAYFEPYNTDSQLQSFSALPGAVVYFKVVYDGNNGGGSTPNIGQVLTANTTGKDPGCKVQTVSLSSYSSQVNQSWLLGSNLGGTKLQTQFKIPSNIFLELYVQTNEDVVATESGCWKTVVQPLRVTWSLSQVNPSGP